MQKNRYYGYDLLRTVSCITVVMLHISSMYIKDDFSTIVSINDYNVAGFFRVMSNLAVPLFVMLSGALLIEKTENIDYKSFYNKMWNRIAFPTILFSALYVSMHYGEIFVAETIGIESQDDNYLLPIINWLKGEPNQTMWFMYMIIGLYIMTPILIEIKKTISIRMWRMLSLGLFVLGIIINYTCELSWVLWWTEWIGYFTLGNVLCGLRNNCMAKKEKWIIFWVLLVFSYGVNVLNWLINSFNKEEISIPTSFSLSVIIGSILSFIAFSLWEGEKENIVINEVAKYSLGIYLIHPLFVEVMMQVCGRVLKWFPPAYLTPLYAVLITMLSYWMSIILDKFGLLCKK
ncbi:Surface polysaccharide O-acyltransferase, integral membrane enzyme [Pseudobutyrivibrio sp. NOR37]|uniref:Acyltransferase n=1 Tax=Pseudobutyrivibrio xylanivorans TaxID=185007 RepID=A0A6M0LKD3_PSEXY|nr:MULTISPECIES: acyltransferase [Pseudobutyrivibrio]NEX02307.1 acyltransferase [Pseudobutyrivibrio xylanivorans]SFR77967.1 Surface polysaccharide O-acyltransferase, integral membrane enzyme [Pseudobutyrivibrio sp. NOR37]